MPEIRIVDRSRIEGVKVKRPRGETLLGSLAQPFYEATGHEIDDRVTPWNLQRWDSIRPTEADLALRNHPVFGQIFNRRLLERPPFSSEFEHLVPESLFKFMDERGFYERMVLGSAFVAARNRGFENVGAIRRATPEQLASLGMGGHRQFLENAFGKVDPSK